MKAIALREDTVHTILNNTKFWSERELWRALEATEVLSTRYYVVLDIADGGPIGGIFKDHDEAMVTNEVFHTVLAFAQIPNEREFTPVVWR